MKKGLFCFFCLLIFPLALWSADQGKQTNIEDWFAANPQAALDYTVLKNDLSDIQKKAVVKNLPFELLFIKFLEGVAKKAAPGQILSVITAEEARLDAIVGMIDKIDNLYKEKNQEVYFLWAQDDAQNRTMQDVIKGAATQALVFKTRTEIIKQISIFIRSGLTLTNMERIFIFSAEKQIPFLLPFYLFSEVIKIPAFSQLKEKDVYLLTHAVLESDLYPSSYSLIPSYFVKGSQHNLSYTVIVHIMVEQLQQSNGFLKMQQEFRRRGSP